MSSTVLYFLYAPSAESSDLLDLVIDPWWIKSTSVTHHIILTSFSHFWTKLMYKNDDFAVQIVSFYLRQSPTVKIGLAAARLCPSTRHAYGVPI